MSKKMKIPIEEAVDFLKPRLKEIDRVGEWAWAMGYRNENRFSRFFRNYYKILPKKVLDEIKAQKAIELLTASNGMSCYE